ncbi:hypothetical protein EYF80_029626 [Liparis tanakae]|uniref:Uncharacterized protein n=1 Tax=Liparis tanakae TaxID=230148 RepID=A0A4Z2H531_9TELE|nr:hypothetical protein EYF80_029626 [Liparis tanakae]
MHSPPCLQGDWLTSHSLTSCLHVFPEKKGVQVHEKRESMAEHRPPSQVPPLRHGELMQALLTGIRQRRSVKPSLQVQLKSTVLPLETARHTPPFMHGEVVHGSRNWHLLPTYPSRHLRKTHGGVSGVPRAAPRQQHFVANHCDNSATTGARIRRETHAYTQLQTLESRGSSNDFCHCRLYEAGNHFGALRVSEGVSDGATGHSGGPTPSPEPERADVSHRFILPVPGKPRPEFN